MASDTDPLVGTTAGKPAAATAPVKGVPGTGPGQATALALARGQKPPAFPNGSGAFPQGGSAYGA
jgi:hypothetical protein